MSKQTFTLGCGDRFGRQGQAQLKAYMAAAERGIEVYPVWNKSHREHQTVHTEPSSVRLEADAATRALGWTRPYFVDADHISLATVDRFLDSSDFFTIDVADSIGRSADAPALDAFAAAMAEYTGSITLPGVDAPLAVAAATPRAVGEKYLFAVQEAGTIYRHIAARKPGAFMVEISMDETDHPQTPVDMLFILAMVAREGIPIDTIAPKFSGRFNKGVDYVGEVPAFEAEFALDVAALAFGVRQFGLGDQLRLSVHSGSDKFSIYPAINRVLRSSGAGLHVKTAGTTWLEEVIGLAEAGGDGLAIAREIYARALSRYDELAAPYATVIDIDPAKLPAPDAVAAWSSREFVDALQHDPGCPAYNASFRQLIHVAYKVAHELGDDYLAALESHAETVGAKVTHNLLERHIVPLFG